MNKVIILSFLLFICSSAFSQKEKSQKWDFNNLNGWVYGHQDDNPVNQCEINNGILKIFTRAQSWDRKKIRTTDKIYTSGRYTWKTYIPQMGEKDQASVGSLL